MVNPSTAYGFSHEAPGVTTNTAGSVSKKIKNRNSEREVREERERDQDRSQRGIYDIKIFFFLYG